MQTTRIDRGCHTKPYISVIVVAVPLLFMFMPKSMSASPKTLPLEAQIYSTMPSTDSHSPVMAMDGSAGTYYQSAYGMDDGDSFVVLLSRPIPVSSVKVISGDPGGNDLLTTAILETSGNQTDYNHSASFGADGTASLSLHGKNVMSLRIRLNQGQSVQHLVIREIVLDSRDKITRVDIGPGRGFVDYSRVPEVANWAARAENQMESFWPQTAALLYSPGFISPNAVNVVYMTGPGVTAIAATGGGVMTVNSVWCDAHPDDTGLTVHEMAHVVQACARYDPVWLIEGEADYIRWVKFEPQHFHPRINVKTATFHDSYQTTAAFLGWCECKYDRTLVTQLNQAVRNGTYSDSLFEQACGKSVDTLWSEFITAYQSDPSHLFSESAPVPADAP